MHAHVRTPDRLDTCSCSAGDPSNRPDFDSSSTAPRRPLRRSVETRGKSRGGSPWAVRLGLLALLACPAAASAQTSLTESNVTETGATLTLTGHSDWWHWKRMSPTPVSNCTAVTTGSTADLDGLTPGQAYTYHAYNGTSCAAENKLAETSFTALDFDVVSKTNTTLTMEMKHYPAGQQWWYRRANPTWGPCYSTSGTQATATGLTKNTSYTFAAYRTAEHCDTNKERIGVLHTKTLPPHALFADNVAQTTATLRLSDANIAWWHKRTSPAGTACTSVANGTTTSGISGLTASTAYTYTAYRTACSAAGEIDDIDFVTLPAAPAKPTVSAGTGEVTLSWVPDSTGGAVIDKWQYAYKTTGNFGAWTDVPGSGASTTSYTVPDLASGTAHVFKVRAHNGTSGGGAGAASPESDSVTPLAVTLAAGSIEAATATLTIAHHTGSWYYQYTAPDGGTCSGEQTGTTADVTGLSGNTSYTFKAYSDVSCGTEVATASAFLTKPAKPAKPSAAAGAGSGKLTLTATLTGGSGALTKWQYQQKEGTGNFSGWNDIDDTDNSLSHVVTGLKDDTNYQFKVRARNATGDGAASDASDAVQPKAVALTASSVEAATATLTIANHGAYQIASWYYQYTSPTGGTCSGEQTGTTADLTGLTGNTSYTFKAYSDVTCGTEVATATAFLTKPAKPGKPAAAAGAGSGKLTLTATLTGGSGALTKWQYQQKEGTGNFSGWNDISDTDNSLSHVVTGLKDNTNYQFKVRARNATGDGAASDASDAVQPKAATLTASSVEAATATLTIAQHTGSWYYQYTSPTGGTCSGEQTGTTADLTGLTGNTSYTFKAYSDVNCGTEVATATAFLTKPAKPAKPAAAAGAGSGKLTLTATLTGGAGALTKWQYQQKEGNGNFSGWNDISDTDNSLSHVVTGLKDDTNYQFKVRARNATGDGDASDASDAVQPKAFGITLSVSTVSLSEGGAAGTYTVRLASQPSAGVTVAVTSAKETAVTVNPASLSFTTTNWDDPQTVTLTPVNDADKQDESVTISHNASGGGYNGVTAALTANVTDSRDGSGTDAAVTLSASTVNLTENGSTGTYTVRLARAPTDDVTVTVTSGDPGAVTVSPATLTFTNANYDDPQRVTLTPVDDDDGRDESVTISHRTSGGETVNLTVTVTDDDPDDDEDGAVTLSASTATLTEGAGARHYTVRLSAAPAADVTVAVASGDPGAVRVSPDTLTFTNANYYTRQRVTLTPVDDDDGRDESVTISHRAAGGDYDGLAADLTADVTDDDRGIALSASTVSLTEGGSGSTQGYTVRLSAAPAADVTVAVASGDPGAVTVSPGTLTFGPSDWNTARTVTVTAVQDDDARDESATVTHTPSGDGYGWEQRAALTVRVADDDQGLVLSADTVEVPEGASASYTVRLSARPAAAVTVALTGSGDADLTFETETRAAESGSALSFTPDDWSRPRTVTLTAAQDHDGVDGEYVVRHTASGGGYDGVSAVLTAVERDDDQVGLSFAPAALSLPEGDSAAYSVRLATRPAADVSVALSADDPALTVSPATLRFAAGTWPAERSVTVTAAAGGGADRTATVTHTASGGEYDGLRGTVAVSVIADLRPSFPPDARVPDQSYTQHREIAPLTLPEASGGDGALTYALTPAPPPGLSFDPATRTLSGTPAAAAAAAAYTYTATDADADDPDSDSLTFTIAVAEAAGGDVLEDVLAAHGRAMLTSVTGVLGERFRAPGRTSGAAGRGSGRGRAAGALARAASMLAAAAGPGAYAAAAAGLPSAADAFRGASPAGGPAGTIRLGGGLGGLGGGLGGGMTGLGGGALGGTAVPPGTIGLGGGMGGLGGGVGGLGGGALGGGLGRAAGSLGGGTQSDLAGLGGGAPGGSALGGGTLGGGAGLGGRALGGGIGPLSSGAGSMTADYGPGGHAPQSGQRPDWGGLVWGQSFAEPLGAADTPPRWTVWGAADLQHYQGAPAGGRHDGALRSLYVGADARVGERVVAGAAISPSWGEADYTTAGGRAAGRLETAQTSVYPYLRWTGAGDLDAWALGGFGRGAAEHRPDLATGMVESSDTSMSMAAAGLRRGLAGWRGLDLAVVGSAGFLSLSTAGTLGGATGLEAGVQQARMALEAAFADGPLSPFVQVGGRYDGGDGQTGAGLELVGGVRHAGPRLDLEARGRWLTAHSAEEWREYGAMARLAFHPRADGTGLQLSLAPSWGLPDGGSMTGAAALMGGSTMPGLPGPGLPTPATDRALSLVNEVGYGLRLTGLPGLVTPTVGHERGFGRVVTRAGLSHRPAEGAFGGKPLTMQLAVGRERSAYGGGSYIFLLTLQKIF